METTNFIQYICERGHNFEVTEDYKYKSFPYCFCGSWITSTIYTKIYPKQKFKIIELEENGSLGE